MIWPPVSVPEEMRRLRREEDCTSCTSRLNVFFFCVWSSPKTTKGEGGPLPGIIRVTPREINISHLGKSSSMSNMPYQGDMLISWRVHTPQSLTVRRWKMLKTTLYVRKVTFLGRTVKLWEGITPRLGYNPSCPFRRPCLRLPHLSGRGPQRIGVSMMKNPKAMDKCV